MEWLRNDAFQPSMGGLPYGVTEADFFGGCSVPRNKEIMRVFRDLEIVEHLGSGIPRVRLGFQCRPTIGDGVWLGTIFNHVAC